MTMDRDLANAAGPPVPARLRELTGETLVELLERAVGRTPGSDFMLMSRGSQLERWTYLDLLERSRRVSGTLAAHGVGRGERVLTWCANDPWLVAAYFAIWRLGGVVVPLDLRMQPDVAVRIGLRTRPVLALVGGDIPPSSVEALGLPILHVAPEELGPDSGPEATAAVPSPVPGPDELAEILFTSGSTGDPKGVTLTHGQVLASGRAITVTSGMGRERALALIPMSHMYGQIVPLLHGLTTGSQLTFPQSLTPASLFAALQRDRITAITVVPQLLQLLMTGIENEAAKRGELGRLNRVRAIAVHLPMSWRRRLFGAVHRRLGGSLAVLTSGGARLPAELQLAWEAMGIEVVQGYGLTEYAAISGHSHRRRTPGTAGRPLSGVEVRLDDNGELLVRGPALMGGYWERPDETAEVLVDGWLHTGDAAQIDRHGELVILSRTRDRITLPNGLKVYPEDVEGALLASGVVKAAVAFEHPAGRIAAVLIPRQASLPDGGLDEAVAAANATLAPHQRVRTWRRWPDDDFPRTHTLKVRRDRVLAWAREQAREDAAPAPGGV